MQQGISLEEIEKSISGEGAAFRLKVKLQPAGGDGDKIFPPTYLGAKYAKEMRKIPEKNEPVDCVLIDSVQSQANRMEEALLRLRRTGQIRLPLLSVDFSDSGIEKVRKVTTLDAPHRIADAIFRDSLLNGVPFRETEIGKGIPDCSVQDSTLLFKYCPTALVFGMWDSFNLKKGSGVKYPRAVVSEIVGIGAVYGVKTGGRLDPIGIEDVGNVAVDNESGTWSLENASERSKTKKSDLPASSKSKKRQKKESPSKIGHGNIPPNILNGGEAGGCTVEYALQTTVISIPAIRRLSFKLPSGYSDKADLAAQTALVTLGLCAATSMIESGYDLRSRCQLLPGGPIEWELIERHDMPPTVFRLTRKQSAVLFLDAVKIAEDNGLPYNDSEIILKPSEKLIDLVRRSRCGSEEETSQAGEDSE